MGLRILILLLTFTVEIHVRAATEQWRHEPIGCSAFSPDCAWLARQSKSQWSFEAIKVTADKGTILWWKDKQPTTLARGTILISSEEVVTIETFFGKVQAQGTFLLEAGDRTVVTALVGNVDIQPRGLKTMLTLPEGYQVSFGNIMVSGKPDVEVPIVAPLNSVLEKWWSLYPGPKSEFLQTAKPFAKAAPGRAAFAGEWHKELVEREIAAAIERERLAKLAREHEARERAKIKALFRKMNYLSSEMPD